MVRDPLRHRGDVHVRALTPAAPSFGTGETDVRARLYLCLTRPHGAPRPWVFLNFLKDQPEGVIELDWPWPCCEAIAQVTCAASVLQPRPALLSVAAVTLGLGLPADQEGLSFCPDVRLQLRLYCHNDAAVRYVDYIVPQPVIVHALCIRAASAMAP